MLCSYFDIVQPENIPVRNKHGLYKVECETIVNRHKENIYLGNLFRFYSFSDQ